METILLTAIDCGIAVQSLSPETKRLLETAYARLRHTPSTIRLSFTVSKDCESGGFLISRDGRDPARAIDEGEFLWLFDKELTIELQKQRCDLFFAHAAALEFANKVHLFVAHAGGGKSTLSWALLHHGFRYLSDELAPVGLQNLRVHPYPRALSLKSDPPPPYPLPHDSLLTSRARYVPVSEAQSYPTQAPVAAIFFLRYLPEASSPAIRRLTVAEASARLYAGALNALAHPGDGLDAAIRVSSQIPCLELRTADLQGTCRLVRGTAETL